MSGERRKQIDYLRRRNEWKRAKPDVAKRFAGYLEVQPDDIVFVDFESARGLIEQVRERKLFSEQRINHIPGGYYRFTSEYADIADGLESLRRDCLDRSVVLIPDQDVIGGIRANLYDVLDHATNWVLGGKEDLIVVAADLSVGILLEHFEDKSGATPRKVYRLSAWTERIILH